MIALQFFKIFLQGPQKSRLAAFETDGEFGGLF